MLCPEVWDFPAPKVKSSLQNHANFQSVSKVIELNNFYKSVIITCPDEMHIPQDVEEAILDDSDYYSIENCPLTEFLEPAFIQSFVKKGKIYCLSADTNCMTDTCVALTPDGVVTIHVLRYIYQSLGLEGTKCLNDYYQIQTNLTDLKNINRLKNAFSKLKPFNFNISWDPEGEDICPSSLAKYFCDRNYKVACRSLIVEQKKPDIISIPSLINSEIDEVVEWIGMLVHGADLSPTEGYISSYCEPESENPIKSVRISILLVKGFVTPNIISKTGKFLSDYAISRELENYWACLSLQTNENSLWQWSPSVPRIFQAHNSSCNIFFSNEKSTIYTVAQLKYT